MAVFLAPIINSQQVDNNGDPLSGGFIEVYLAGTSTPSTTFSDKAGVVPNTTPIVLNTLGVNNQGEIWLTGGATYKFVIKNSTGIVQRTLDNVSGINDTTVAADQWILFPAPPTFVSATSFTLVGDQTQTFQVGRRIKTLNTGGVVYSTIAGSVFSSPNTTITVRNDSGVLDAGLSQVSYGVLSVGDTSLPGGLINYGQCRLTKIGANLQLNPYNGSRITIGNQICLIPSGGVALAPTGAVPGTLYNIYAFMSGATLALEFSTTAHSTDAVTGIEIKTGDPTRTLVGKAQAIAGPNWVDTDLQRLVLSWFNRTPRRCYNIALASVPTNSVVPVGIVAQVQFLTWGDFAIPFSFVGSVANNTANQQCNSALGLDAIAFSHTPVIYQAYAISTVGAACGATTFLPAEGFHFVTLCGSVSGGTGTWQANIEFSGVIQG